MREKEERTRDLGTELRLIIVPFHNYTIFPHASCWIILSEKYKQKHIIEMVLQNDPAECLIVVQNNDLAENDPASFSDIGVVARTEIENKKVNFFAKYRAEVKEPLLDPKKRIWTARASRLPDVPASEELTDNHHDLPMILGCVESVFVLLQELKPLIKEKNLADKIEELVKNLKSTRREKERAYSLPWHLLIFFDYLPEKVKNKMLRANSVIERLQIAVDILKMEKQILRNAEILSEEELGCPEKMWGK